MNYLTRKNISQNPFRSKNIHQTMQWIMRKQVVYPDYLDGKTIDFISKVRLSLFLHWF